MQFLNRVEVVGTPQRWRSITVWGLRGDVGSLVDYGLASRNFERGKLKILETGVVGEIKLVSSSGRYTLVPEGMRLIGGRQDRVVNASVIIPPNTEIGIRVSCVESNRWAKRAGVDATQFSIATSLATPRQRATLKSTTGGGYQANQQSVWESVDQTVTSIGGVQADGRGSLTQAYEAVETVRDEALAELAYVPNANGIAVAVNGKIRTVEFFNNDRKLQQIWSQIVGAHLVEASAVENTGIIPTDADIHASLAVLTTSRWQEIQAASAGLETRSDFGSGNATVLELDGGLVHASVVYA